MKVLLYKCEIYQTNFSDHSSRLIFGTNDTQNSKLNYLISYQPTIFPLLLIIKKEAEIRIMNKTFLQIQFK